MRAFRLAMAFVGILIGAGFASGQEVLQYFTSFGIWGIIGSIIATAVFGFLGYVLVDIGNHFQAISHDEVIQNIVSPFVGKLIDIFLLITLFGIGVVMIAGAGSNLNQQFGLPIWVGSSLVSILVILIGLMNTDKVLSAIGAIAPLLITLIIIIAVTTLFTNDVNFQELNQSATTLPTSLPNWLISSLNYASVNLTTGAATAFLLGGYEKDPKVARKGGLMGGIITGLLIVVINLTLFIVVDQVATYDLPMLEMASLIHPIVGFIMSILIFLEIWNTAMSVLYSFVLRFSNPKNKSFKWWLILTVSIGFFLSFGGFTDVIAFVYPAVGYGGFIILGIFVYKFIGIKKRKLLIKPQYKQET